MPMNANNAIKLISSLGGNVLKLKKRNEPVGGPPLVLNTAEKTKRHLGVEL
jgi:hypothetical protein